jgi:predicted AlkP superfamily phosphohydrolase/phosphomutase
MSSASAAKKPRVLLIGLDSGDAELIERYMADGFMPTFAKLREQGLWERVGTTADVMHVSAWPTLYSGTTPGQHGLYHAYQVYAGEQLIRRPDPAGIGKPPFWKYLDDAGRKCIILDAFMNAELPDFKGMQILEYGTWTWFGAQSSTPAGLLDRIKARFGPYPAPEHTIQVKVPDEPLRFRDQLIAGTQVKSRITQSLMQEHDWDLMFVTFGEPHGAGHYLWHFDDTNYPVQPGEAALRGARMLRDVYSAVDEAIAGILAATDDQTTVIITSGDGMGPNYAGAQLMPEMLHQMGLFYSGNVGGGEQAQSATRAPKKGILSVVREAIPLGWRQSVSRCMPRGMRGNLSLKWLNAGIDWKKSKLFCIPNSNEGYFRVNLAGREPLGVVNRGAEYDDLLGSLRVQLEQLTNPDNGMRAAERVGLTDDIYPGPRRQDLPDALVTWNPEARLGNAIATPDLGVIRRQACYEVSPFYTGNHRPNAFVMARGPALRAGAKLENGHIMDIAPTILAMLGVSAPAHFEGRVWQGFS